MAKPLIQMALDSLDKMNLVASAQATHYIEFNKTPIPKPSRKIYQTRRGKWINCK